jgi:redox-sensitive bicupin YhaK (pirin superfamily)
MNTVLHTAQSRGHANHGWLVSHHSFSFGQYFDSERVNFGMLRVLNDDHVAPGQGFGTHPHDNMEIISIPLEGDLEHRDSMGTQGIIGANEVQVMSAGTGITHSEYNHSKEKPVKFLQIWIFPKVRNIAPRYGQRVFPVAERRNMLQKLVTPIEDAADSLKINQDAYLSRTLLDAGGALRYPLNKSGHGVYLFVINGSATAAGIELQTRDALGVEDTAAIDMSTSTGADILVIEVPMTHPYASS